MSDSVYYQGQIGSSDCSSDWYTTSNSIYADGEISQDGNKVWIGGKWVDVWKDDVIKSEEHSHNHNLFAHNVTYSTVDDRVNKIIDILGEMANALENAHVCEGMREKINVLKKNITYWPGFPIENTENKFGCGWYNERHVPEKKEEKIELEKELFEI